MNTKLLKTYQVEIPEVKFIGKCYHEEDRVNGTFGYQWGKWFANGLFGPIEATIQDPNFIEDGNAYCGICRMFHDGSYEYWIGMIVPETDEVPEGYASFIIPACSGIVNWVYGKEPDIYFHSCLEEMDNLGYSWDKGPDQEKFMMERYVHPRFTIPDEEGNKIIDLVYLTYFKEG